MEVSIVVIMGNRSLNRMKITFGLQKDQYELMKPLPTRDRACKNYTVCAADQFCLTAPTPTSDRVW